MTEHKTVTGSLEKFEKGTLNVIEGSAKHYCHSNVFDVASRAKPYEKIAVARNLEYVVEVVRAEGESPWFGATHDEFVVVMDGEVTVNFSELGSAQLAADKDGTQRLKDAPLGKKVGAIHLKRGHQALLPKGTGYRFSARSPAVMIQQTLAGELTIHKWAEICSR